MAERNLTVKYTTRCRDCGSDIQPGENALYDHERPRGKRLRHADCGKPRSEESSPDVTALRAQLEACSKSDLIEIHRRALGSVGDTARTAKAQYVHALVGWASVPPGSIQAMRDHITAVNLDACNGAGEEQDEKGEEPANVSAAVESVMNDAPKGEGADALVAAIRAIAGASLNERQITAIVERTLTARISGIADKIREEVKSIAPREIVVNNVANNVRVNLGKQHRLFPQLLAVIAAAKAEATSINVWLTGPTGSGKTEASKAIARALGLNFYFNGAMDTEYKVTGFKDANGIYHDTAFYRAYKNGGIYLADEIDGSFPNATLALQAALSNGLCDFPGETVERHPEFFCIAAANTYGLGGTDDYVGRFKQDAAFLSRFVRFQWDYDEQFERELAQHDSWVSFVQECRAKARAKGLRVVISPRASIFGATLLRGGLDRDTVIALTIKNGMTAEQWNNIR